VNPQNAILPVQSLRMLFVMSNVKNRNVKLNAQTKAAKCLIAQNVLQSVNNPTVLHTAKPRSLSVSLYVKSPNAIGNVISLIVSLNN
jgi:hypothetical protein